MSHKNNITRQQQHYAMFQYFVFAASIWVTNVVYVNVWLLKPTSEHQHKCRQQIILNMMPPISMQRL